MPWKSNHCQLKWLAAQRNDVIAAQIANMCAALVLVLGVLATVYCFPEECCPGIARFSIKDASSTARVLVYAGEDLAGSITPKVPLELTGVCPGTLELLLTVVSTADGNPVTVDGYLNEIRAFRVQVTTKVLPVRVEVLPTAPTNSDTVSTIKHTLIGMLIIIPGVIFFLVLISYAILCRGPKPSSAFMMGTTPQYGALDTDIELGKD